LTLLLAVLIQKIGLTVNSVILQRTLCFHNGFQTFRTHNAALHEPTRRVVASGRPDGLSGRPVGSARPPHLVSCSERGINMFVHRCFMPQTSVTTVPNPSPQPVTLTLIPSLTRINSNHNANPRYLILTRRVRNARLRKS